MDVDVTTFVYGACMASAIWSAVLVIVLATGSRK